MIPEAPIRSDRRPLYEQVQAAILGRMADGTYRAGAKLPPEDRLAASLGVSRTTVRTAPGNLETLGHIRRVQGAGTFVVARSMAVQVELAALESFHPRLAARLGLASRIANLDISVTSAGAGIATAMGLAPGTPVVRVSRSLEFEGLPVAYLCDCLPAALVSPAELRAHFHDSIVDYCDGRPGRPEIAWSNSELSTVRADAAVGALLNVGVGEVLLAMQETFYSSTDTLVSYSQNYIIPDHFKFHIRRRVVR